MSSNQLPEWEKTAFDLRYEISQLEAYSDILSGMSVEALREVDRGVVEIRTDLLGFTLSTEQLVAIESLKGLFLNTIKVFGDNISDTGVFYSPFSGGQYLSVSNYKNSLALSDWIIFPSGYRFANGQTTGEVLLTDRGPEFHITIDTLVN